MIEEYAGHLRSTEVNSSFYRLSNSKTLALWLNSTPEDFVYIRLHCSNGPYRGNYERDVLAEWAEFLVTWANMGRGIYCYFDNDENGYAAHKAITLQDMVAEILRPSP